MKKKKKKKKGNKKMNQFVKSKFICLVIYSWIHGTT